jgi:DNA repair exonuclease SbcCD nuclease subunit
MSFSFLHAADLHLGSPFTGLTIKDEAVAKRFAAASRDAFSSLVTNAINAKVAFVVIAGDVYDGEWKDASIGLFFNREVARLERSGISLYLLKGNHDAESIVTKAISLPDSVHQFPTNKPRTFQIREIKVAIHGRSFPERAVTENYALSYPAPRPGYFNIGILHTSCDGRPGHANYAPCTVQDLASRNYQYWALGHVHGYEVLSRDPWIVFPGNLQGRNVREPGPKGAVIVDVNDGHVTDVKRVIVDSARWAEVLVDLDGVDQEADMLRNITDAIRPVAQAAVGRLLALRVRLEGQTSLHSRLKSDPRTFTDEVQAAAHRCHEDVWLERLQIETKGAGVPTAASHGFSDTSLDLGATLAGLEHDPNVHAKAAEIVASIVDRLPGGIVTGDIPLVDDLDKLLGDASALVLGRTMRQQES